MADNMVAGADLYQLAGSIWASLMNRASTPPGARTHRPIALMEGFIQEPPVL